ncbi:malonyl-ACP O-methyltransferase BioC [Acerihabitans sp.]|uniref:malonyl-ACP O-methyltransferase BioC n=1 Tax=Acerihabitans sp. TaxID=2811394 RepID=UPI002ED968DF
MHANAHKAGIARAFGRAAADYEHHAALQRESGDRLTALLGAQPGRCLLDAGCGTGWFSRRWQEAGSRVVALDLSPAMLAEARRHRSASVYLAGDIERLPLADACVDICFSNLAVQWCDDLPRALAEFYRVTRPGGLIALSTLAEGSLGELQHAWSQVDQGVHINRFLTAGTIDRAFAPYRHRLSAARHTLHYPHLSALLHGLKGVGAGYLRDGRTPGLTGRRRLALLDAAWQRQTAGLPLSYQLIYGLIYRD